MTAFLVGLAAFLLLLALLGALADRIDRSEQRDARRRNHR